MRLPTPPPCRLPTASCGRRRPEQQRGRSDKKPVLTNEERRLTSYEVSSSSSSHFIISCFLFFYFIYICSYNESSYLIFVMTRKRNVFSRPKVIPLDIFQRALRNRLGVWKLFRETIERTSCNFWRDLVKN